MSETIREAEPKDRVEYEPVLNSFQSRVETIREKGLLDGYSALGRSAKDGTELSSVVYEKIIRPRIENYAIAEAVLWSEDEVYVEGSDPPNGARVVALALEGYFRYTVTALGHERTDMPDGIYHTDDQTTNLIAGGRVCTVHRTLDIAELGSRIGSVDRCSEPFETSGAAYDRRYWEQFKNATRQAIWKSASSRSKPELEVPIPRSKKVLKLTGMDQNRFENLEGGFVAFSTTSKQMAERAAEALGHSARVYQRIEDKQHFVIVPIESLL